MVKINATEIINKVKKVNSDRVRKSLYLSDSLYKEFEKICQKQGVPVSKVMEELINSFIESTK